MVSSGILRFVALLQEPHGVTIQKTPFYIVTAVNTSYLTSETQSLIEFPYATIVLFTPRNVNIMAEEKRKIGNQETSSVAFSPKADYTDRETATFRRR
jgi:hypothetical protein